MGVFVGLLVGCFIGVSIMCVFQINQGGRN